MGELEIEQNYRMDWPLTSSPIYLHINNCPDHLGNTSVYKQSKNWAKKQYRHLAAVSLFSQAAKKDGFNGRQMQSFGCHIFLNWELMTLSWGC